MLRLKLKLKLMQKLLKLQRAACIMYLEELTAAPTPVRSVSTPSAFASTPAVPVRSSPAPAATLAPAVPAAWVSCSYCEVYCYRCIYSFN